MVRGRNVHPQDAERIAAAAHTALDPDAAAAFGFEENGAEALAVVLEVDRHTPAEQLAGLADGVRSAVAAELDVAVAAVHFTRRGGIPGPPVESCAGRRAGTRGCRRAAAAGDRPGIPGPAVGPADGAGDLRSVLAAVARLSPTRWRTRPASSTWDWTRWAWWSCGCASWPSSAPTSLSPPCCRGRPWPSWRLPWRPRPGRPPVRTARSGRLPGLGGPGGAAARGRSGRGGRPYVVGRAVKVLGAFRTEDFLRAVRRVVARHPGLRTAFVPGDQAMVRALHADLPPELTVADAVGLTEAELTARLEAAACRRMDPQTGPLVRVTVLRTEESETVVVSPSTTRSVTFARSVCC
ncbi:hypothetical protein O1L68_43655 [Streptomyces lydicus]|nr:hypothetical protein [Streptomyces lydicus]